MTSSGSAPALYSKTSSHSRLWLQLRLHTPALNCSFMCAMIKFNILFFLLFSTVILLTRRKATEALIHRVGNYPDLLPEMPRYCCTRNLIEILLQFRTPFQNHQAGKSSIKCLSQEQNRVVQVDFEPRPC